VRSFTGEEDEVSGGKGGISVKEKKIIKKC
jgi:hypothetical protein